MKKVISVEASIEHIEKMQKWLALNPLQRFEIMQKANALRGKQYKTESAHLAACLKLI